LKKKNFPPTTGKLGRISPSGGNNPSTGRNCAGRVRFICKNGVKGPMATKNRKNANPIVWRGFLPRKWKLGGPLKKGQKHRKERFWTRPREELFGKHSRKKRDIKLARLKGGKWIPWDRKKPWGKRGAEKKKLPDLKKEQPSTVVHVGTKTGKER